MVSVSLHAGERLNPDPSGRPSPLVVRIYELRGRTAFESADFIGLYEKDADLLRADLVKKQQWHVQPGQTLEVAAHEVPNDVAFVAVFAAYRDLERANWRAVVPVKAQYGNTLLVQLDDLRVQIAPEAP